MSHDIHLNFSMSDVTHTKLILNFSMSFVGEEDRRYTSRTNVNSRATTGKNLCVDDKQLRGHRDGRPFPCTCVVLSRIAGSVSTFTEAMCGMSRAFSRSRRRRRPVAAMVTASDVRACSVGASSSDSIGAFGHSGGTGGDNNSSDGRYRRLRGGE